MDEKEAKKIVDYTFKEVFGVDNPLSLEDSRKVWAHDIPIPEEVPSMLSGQKTWGVFKKGLKVASQADLITRSAKDEFMRPKKKIGSMDELLKIWDEINFYTGERYMDSKETAESDGIYNSYGVYRSQLQFGSQNMIYCYNNHASKYLVASRDNNACTNGIRLDQCGYTSSSYEVVWSAKVSRSMFVNNCFDLFECIFCTQLRSKKYCIANMQFEKDEYMQIKEMIVKWVVDDLRKRARK